MQNLTEIKRWFDEGRTYEWMIQTYLEKYNIETTRSMWANLRRRQGWDPRIVIDKELIPWKVAPEHEHSYPIQMLRILARRRAGMENPGAYNERLDSWLAMLARENAVVYYDHELGFFYVPREAQDGDVIRQPVAAERRR